MIYIKRQFLHRYKGICPALDTAIDYLEGKDLNALQPGRSEVDGDTVFINRSTYTTLPRQEALWEGHKRYGDIHIMIAGQEKIGITDVSCLQETVFKEAEDFVGFEGEVANWYPMGEGDVLIVFPEDIHLVKVQAEGPMEVTRAVVKFRL